MKIKSTEWRLGEIYGRSAIVCETIFHLVLLLVRYANKDSDDTAKIQVLKHKYVFIIWFRSFQTSLENRSQQVNLEHYLPPAKNSVYADSNEVQNGSRNFLPGHDCPL